MPKLLHASTEYSEGYNTIVTPGDGALNFIEFGLIRLSDSLTCAMEPTDDREWALDIVEGACEIRVSSRGGEELVYSEAGNRESFFSGPPTMLYVPRGWGFEVRALSRQLEVTAFSAPSSVDSRPTLVSEHDVRVATPGKANWKRTVYSGIVENVNAERLLVGETFNRPGCWSSFPPHKHDELRPPEEYPLEEVYYFRTQPESGFGVQLLYTDPASKAEAIDEVYRVANRDTVVIPRGYHPVAAAPGYRLGYVWCLAGDHRKYGAWKDDPDHSWVAEESVEGGD